MAYERQNFANGEILRAEQLNKMEEGIINAESMVNANTGSSADVYVLVGRMGKVKNGSVSISLYKNGQACDDTLYLRTMVSSGGGEWREHGSSTGSFKTTKSWSFGGTDDGIAWLCEIFADSTKANLLASCFIHGGAKGDTGEAGTGGDAPGLMVVEFDGSLATWMPGQIYEHIMAGGTAVWDMNDRDYGYATLTSCSESNAMFTFISAEEGWMQQLCVFDDGSAEIFEFSFNS